MRCLRNIAMLDYEESVTTGQTQTPDTVIPMCRYALQATQKSYATWNLPSLCTGFTVAYSAVWRGWFGIQCWVDEGKRRGFWRQIWLLLQNTCISNKRNLQIALNYKEVSSPHYPPKRHVVPWRKQRQNMQNLQVPHILTPPQGYVMSVKCEQPIDKLTVQVWLPYHHSNFNYCTL